MKILFLWGLGCEERRDLWERTRNPNRILLTGYLLLGLGLLESRLLTFFIRLFMPLLLGMLLIGCWRELHLPTMLFYLWVVVALE